jgi:hypothetical protein
MIADSNIREVRRSLYGTILDGQGKLYAATRTSLRTIPEIHCGTRDVRAARKWFADGITSPRPLNLSQANASNSVPLLLSGPKLGEKFFLVS